MDWPLIVVGSVSFALVVLTAAVIFGGLFGDDTEVCVELRGEVEPLDVHALDVPDEDLRWIFTRAKNFIVQVGE